MEYSFKAKIVYGGYHVFKGTTWNNVKEEKPTCFKKTLILTHVQSVRKNQFFNSWKTVGHIPREISRHVCYFIKTEGGSVDGSVLSTK